jgi:Gly-Xaa carboxypeptidase
MRTQKHLIMRFPDTRHYWSLTKHIFRYGHRGTTDGYNGAHTINEGKQVAALPTVLSITWRSRHLAIKAEGFLEQIRFFTRLILNADETDLLE